VAYDELSLEVALKMPFLDQIESPADLRKYPFDELTALAREMRERIFASVSCNGGHLASNLGVVELTLALHYVYEFGPYPSGPDRLLWDVGHQCYPHKMLTGRAEQFARLRKKGSVGGFPAPEESPYDLFAVGHAGTAISTAVGMARSTTTAWASASRKAPCRTTWSACASQPPTMSSSESARRSSMSCPMGSARALNTCGGTSHPA
jgi:deoxyxylulose-5-phosphate synthase